MSELFGLSLDAIAISAVTCMVLREAFIVALPNNLAGPGGSFIDTDRRS
jgi:hypothetical protein